MDGVFKTAVIFPLHKVRCSINYPPYKSTSITFKGMVGLSKALRVFEDEGLNLVHIESRKVKGSKDKVSPTILPSYSHTRVID